MKTLKMNWTETTALVVGGLVLLFLVAFLSARIVMECDRLLQLRNIEIQKELIGKGGMENVMKARDEPEI